jgi:hypothetical protein
MGQWPLWRQDRFEGTAEVAKLTLGCDRPKMNLFPPAASLQFLVGEVIGQICLDPNSLQFRFEDGGQITVEDRIEHVDGSGAVHAYECGQRDGPIFLHQLVQTRIDKVEVDGLCLSLGFDGGAVLRIFSELCPYECGQIYPAEKGAEPIVF